MAYTHSDLKGALPLLTTGKVRDLYEVDPATLLFVATDRISAYDVIMENVSRTINVLISSSTAFQRAQPLLTRLPTRSLVFVLGHPQQRHRPEPLDRTLVQGASSRHTRSTHSLPDPLAPHLATSTHPNPAPRPMHDCPSPDHLPHRSHRARLSIRLRMG
jgi:hypothetical protein